MIWLLFVSSLFGPEVIHHRIPLPDAATCRTLAGAIPLLFRQLDEPLELAPGVWAHPQMAAFPQAVCRATP